MVIRHLEILEAVAETGTFTSAAKKLFITQSAVSHAAAELEKQAGTALSCCQKSSPDCAHHIRISVYPCGSQVRTPLWIFYSAETLTWHSGKVLLPKAVFIQSC